MPTVFLSYARADKATASTVVQSLKDAGLTMWWDADIPLGPAWQEVLQKRLSECSACVVLIGNQGVSGWIRAEVGVALSRHFARDGAAPMDIVSVLLEGAAEEAVPPFLALFQLHRLSDVRDSAEAAGFDNPVGLRSSNRYDINPGGRDLDLGFRVVCRPTSP